MILMYKLLRRIKKALPAPNEIYYYSSKHYYETLKVKYSTLEPYLKLLKQFSQLSPIKSSIEVKSELGSTIESILKKYGKPRHRFTNMTPLSNQVLFYKFLLGGHKVKCEMHFCKNRLFLFKYIFSYLTPENRDKIADMVSLKYLDRSVDFKIHKISSENGKEISIYDSAEFTISYLDGKSDFFPEAISMTTEMKNQNEKKSDMYNKELLNRL